jgi:hypothetical protein
MAETKVSDSHYSQYLPDLTQSRFTTMATQDAHVYAQGFKQSGNPPWLHALYVLWQKLLKEPFKGVTNDGKSPFSITAITPIILTITHLPVGVYGIVGGSSP